MHWALRYRNSRAMVLAVFAVFGIGYFALFHSTAKVVDREHIEGRVAAIDHWGDSPIVVVDLADGRQARVLARPGVEPNVGTLVPLIVIRTDDGKSNAVFDLEKWIEQ